MPDLPHPDAQGGQKVAFAQAHENANRGIGSRNWLPNGHTSQQFREFSADLGFDKPRDPAETPQLSRTPKVVQKEPETHNGTTSGITNHESLTRLQFMEVRQVRTMYRGSLRFTKLQTLVRFQSNGTRIEEAYVIMRRRSRQSWSRALTERTSPAVIAASRIISQPLASHAAGTVSQTSAESTMRNETQAQSENWRFFSLTKVGDRADLAGYLLLCVFPHAV